jgi:ABC-type hemin transport system substrate-binding protein
VTFSPALTQIVFDMGLGEHVVAVERHSILPAGLQRVSLGDVRHIEPEAILAAEPDILLVQMRLDQFESVRRLRPDLRIEHFEIETLADIRRAVERIGRLVGKADLGRRRAERFQQQLEAVRRRARGRARPRVLFVIGYEKPAVAGKGTFIDDLVGLCGGVNAGDPGRPHKRWRTVDLEEILAAAPEVIVCQADPARREAARQYWLARGELPAARAGRVHVVTDSRWTIPSTFSAEIARRLAGLIHPPAGEGPPR